MYQVIKRDNQVVDFDINKISSVIKKAFDGSNHKYHDSIIDLLTLRVTADFEQKIIDNKITVESIQDSVEQILISSGYGETAKAYILYRKQREKIRNVKTTILDYKSYINNYIDYKDNDNQKLTIGDLVISNSKAITENYWLNEIYDQEIKDAHNNCDIYIHDLDTLTGRDTICYLKQLINKGPNNLSDIFNELYSLICLMHNEWSNKLTINSFDTLLVPFIKVDNLTYNQVKTIIKTFIYNINIPNKYGTQIPNINIILDWIIPNNIKDDYCIINGNKQTFKYKDCQQQMNMLNKAYLEIMINNNYKYPIPTYIVNKDFNTINNNKLLYEFTTKYGVPYFVNNINNKYNYNNKGSLGIISINLVRLGYTSNNQEEFYTKLDHILDISIRALNTKKRVLTKLLEEGLYPYTKKYINNYDDYNLCISLIGFNELGLNTKWINKDITNSETISYTNNILNYINNKLDIYSNKYNNKYNIEEINNTNILDIFYKYDKEIYSDIIGDNYTNSVQCSNKYKDDIFEILDIQNKLQTLYTGCITFNIMLEKDIINYNLVGQLITNIINNYNILYFKLLR